MPFLYTSMVSIVFVSVMKYISNCLSCVIFFPFYNRILVLLMAAACSDDLNFLASHVVDVTVVDVTNLVNKLSSLGWGF